ncbi:Methionine--tRNA ligase [Frankliniella fusca]|uniref:Methionine--tRNA ligase n=1 Tax=Frankliniella fusca TaxID=407009 RepID=A0AAE1LS38_9NEOP|nr:Methionine--tRNA ligase [Frankliniella fusca]
MIMSQASNVLSLQTFGKCRLRDRTLWNKAMIFSLFFTSSGKAFILLSFKLRFKKTVGLLSLDLKAIMYDCSSILSYTFYLTSKYTIVKIMEEA